MQYFDRTYGKVEIDDPLALEIIASAPFQRLKHIDQGGYRPLYNVFGITFSGNGQKRFNHSVGVYLLLKKYDAPREEQIAGLIHDISHHTFSHAAEYALESSTGQQDHQDKNHDQFVRKSEVAKILKKYNIDIDYILNDENFPLKENNLPALCADRIDYLLRDSVEFRAVNVWRARQLLKKIKVVKNQWVFADYQSARAFARLFKKMNDKFFAPFTDGVMLAVVGDFLKYSIQKNYISEDDFWTTDREIIKKILKHLKNDLKLEKLWALMSRKVACSNNSRNYTRRILAKSRAVDPLFIAENGDILKVSDHDPKWGEIVKRELKPKEYFVKYGVELE